MVLAREADLEWERKKPIKNDFTEIIMLNKITQTRKEKYHMFFFIRGI
jgi:hypothetical protein